MLLKVQIAFIYYFFQSICKLNYLKFKINNNTIEKWLKGWIFFPITKNYRDITLTAIDAKVNNAQFLNSIQQVVEKVLWKNQNCFQTSQILTIH